MESKHTPGPWKVKAHTILDQGGNTVAQAHHPFYRRGDVEDTDPREANARLLAAAPELLDALYRLESVVTKALAGGYNHQMAKYHVLAGEYARQARSAIARATNS